MLSIGEVSYQLTLRYLGVGFALIGLLLVVFIAVYSFRVYKKTGIEKAKKFGISFSLIGGGVVLSSVVVVAYIFDMKRYGITELLGSSFLSPLFIYVFFFNLGLISRIIGYFTLATTLLRLEKTTKYFGWALIALAFIIALIIPYTLAYRFLEATLGIVLFTLAAAYLQKAIHKKTYLPFIAFTLLFFGSVCVVFGVSNSIFHLFSYVFKIAGLSILFYYMYSAKGSVKGRVGKTN